MAVNIKIEKQPDGGFAVVFEEDGSGDFNRIMGDLCGKHRIAKERGEEIEPQTTNAIFNEILQAIDENTPLDEADIDNKQN